MLVPSVTSPTPSPTNPSQPVPAPLTSPSHHLRPLPAPLPSFPCRPPLSGCFFLPLGRGQERQPEVAGGAGCSVPPSAADRHLKYLRAESCRPLRTLLCSAEQLPGQPKGLGVQWGWGRAARAPRLLPQAPTTSMLLPGGPPACLVPASAKFPQQRLLRQLRPCWHPGSARRVREALIEGRKNKINHL